MSMATLIKDLGLKGGERKWAIERIGKVAEEASHSLWKARRNTRTVLSRQLMSARLV